MTARALKAVDPRLRVGGPATAQAAGLIAFIAHCTENHVPFDFVSTHVVRATIRRRTCSERMSTIPRARWSDARVRKVYDQVKTFGDCRTCRSSGRSLTPRTRTARIVTDTAFMGPWMANKIRQCDGLDRHDVVLDVFRRVRRTGMVKTPLYGGFGLIAERRYSQSRVQRVQVCCTALAITDWRTLPIVQCW